MIKNKESKIIEVPIMNEFQLDSIPVGKVILIKDSLPKNTDWVLSLGYRTLHSENNETKEYDILCFGLIPQSKLSNLTKE